MNKKDKVSRDVSTGTTSATAVAPKFSDTLILFQPGMGRFCPPPALLHLNFPCGYIPVVNTNLFNRSHWLFDKRKWHSAEPDSNCCSEQAWSVSECWHQLTSAFKAARSLAVICSTRACVCLLWALELAVCDNKHSERYTIFERHQLDEKNSGKSQAILYIYIFVNFSVRNFDRRADSNAMKNF